MRILRIGSEGGFGDLRYESIFSSRFKFGIGFGDVLAYFRRDQPDGECRA